MGRGTAAKKKRASSRRSDDDPRRAAVIMDTDDDEDDHKKMGRGSAAKKKRASSRKGGDDDDSRRASSSQQSAMMDDDDEDDDDDNNNESQLAFSQQAPELSQSVPPAKKHEKKKLYEMREENRLKACTDLSRLLLFKALSGEPIDRAKCIKEAGITAETKISSAAFQEAEKRLNDVFGFELKRCPKYMEKMRNFPAKYKDRYFVINGVHEDKSGEHSKAIHSVHTEGYVEKGLPTSIEKSLLMVILSLVYCKGEPRSDGSRWITDRSLYTLLNCLDENIPKEPPAPGARGARAQQSRVHAKEGVGLTPDVDKLLIKFLELDYLLKEKATQENYPSAQELEEGTMIYAMGPRAAMEIGRKQIIFFCAEILDEDPDPTMLKEVEEDPDEDESQQA